MSFFDLSDNTKAEGNGQFESGGGDIEPIPKNTDVLAAPEEAKWDEFDGNEFISVRWTVLAPKEYQNRKVFQKIRVLDPDTKKSDKAKRMLAAIDTNAGGKLLASGKKPTDESLTKCLVNKPMVLKLQVWEIETDDGSKKRGNWVSAVSPRKGGKAQKEPEPAPEPAPADEDFDDDVGF